MKTLVVRVGDLKSILSEGISDSELKLANRTYVIGPERLKGNTWSFSILTNEGFLDGNSDWEPSRQGRAFVRWSDENNLELNGVDSRYSDRSIERFASLTGFSKKTITHDTKIRSFSFLADSYEDASWKLKMMIADLEGKGFDVSVKPPMGGKHKGPYR